MNIFICMLQKYNPCGLLSICYASAKLHNNVTFHEGLRMQSVINVNDFLKTENSGNMHTITAPNCRLEELLERRVNVTQWFRAAE